MGMGEIDGSTDEVQRPRRGAEYLDTKVDGAARTCCLGQGEAVTETDWSATRNAEATRSAKMGNYSADGGLMYVKKKI